MKRLFVSKDRPVPPAPLPHSYWVIYGRFLAGAHPSADRRSARANLARLFAAGIDTLFDLTEEGEYGIESYMPASEGMRDAQGCAVTCRQFPIADLTIPSLEQMIRLLNAIDADLEAGRSIYAHCFAGLGRVGTVVGCYLARHGIHGEQALERLAWMRQRVLEWGDRSPTTSAQRVMVRYWPAGR